MKWSSKVSEEFSLTKAVDECVAHVRAELGDTPPDLAIVFVSPHHAPEYSQVPLLLKERLGARVLLGCSGGGVIGGGKEVEDHAGFTLTAAMLPQVNIAPFHIEEQQLPDMDASPLKWEAIAGTKAAEEPAFVVLADPFTIRGDNLLAGLDYAFPGRVKVGGLASGSDQAGGGNALFLGDEIFTSGAVGVAISGAVRVETVVAQGCRPIGDTMMVTKCQQNVMLEVDNEKPLARLQRIFETCDERDRLLINRALHLGVVTDPWKEQYLPGDFLIRNVLGIHRETEGVIVGEMLHEGQVVQFHVRDAMTAEEDLYTLLRQYAKDRQEEEGSGALLFSCLGRGVHLFGAVNHDTGIFAKEVGLLPLGGFFCNGEIGPVGPNTYLHGFTSSFAIFRPKEIGPATAPA